MSFMFVWVLNLQLLQQTIDWGNNIYQHFSRFLTNKKRKKINTNLYIHTHTHAHTPIQTFALKSQVSKHWTGETEHFAKHKPNKRSVKLIIDQFKFCSALWKLKERTVKHFSHFNLFHIYYIYNNIYNISLHYLYWQYQHWPNNLTLCTRVRVTLELRH